MTLKLRNILQYVGGWMKGGWINGNKAYISQNWNLSQTWLGKIDKKIFVLFSFILY